MLFADTFMIPNREILQVALNPASNSAIFLRTMHVHYAGQARMSFSVVNSGDLQRDADNHIRQEVPEHLDGFYFNFFLGSMCTPDGRTK